MMSLMLRMISHSSIQRGYVIWNVISKSKRFFCSSSSAMNSENVSPNRTVYAVAKGREIGIFDTREESLASTHRYSGAIWKKFVSCKEAFRFIMSHNTFVSTSTEDDVMSQLSGSKCKNKGDAVIEDAGTPLSAEAKRKTKDKGDAVIEDAGTPLIAKTKRKRKDKGDAVIEDAGTPLIAKTKRKRKHKGDVVIEDAGTPLSAEAKRKTKDKGDAVIEDAGTPLIAEAKRKTKDKGDAVIEDAGTPFIAKTKRKRKDTGDAVIEDAGTPLITKTKRKNKDKDDAVIEDAGTPLSGSTESVLESLCREEGRVVVFTDGACSGSPSCRKGGIGVFWADNHQWNKSQPLVRGEDTMTNNRAEIKAALIAIREAVMHNVGPVDVRTDSEYLIKSMCIYRHKWLKNGWKKSTGALVQHKDLFKELNALCSGYEHRITWTHVKGHSNIYGNEMADQLATAGARLL